MRRLAPSMLLAVAAAVAIAVGQEGGSDSAQAAVTGAAARTTATGSSRFTVRMLAPEMPDEIADGLVVEGAVDYVHHRGRITSAGVDEYIFDGKVAYVDLAPFGLKDKWLRNEGALDEWNDALDLQQQAMFHADDLLQFLRAASDGVREAGHDDVRGVATTRYEGTLDLRKVVEQRRPTSANRSERRWSSSPSTFRRPCRSASGSTATASRVGSASTRKTA